MVTPGMLLPCVVGWMARAPCALLHWVAECLGLPGKFVAFAQHLDQPLSHHHPPPPHLNSLALVVLCTLRGTVPHLTTTGIEDNSAWVLL